MSYVEAQDVVAKLAEKTPAKSNGQIQIYAPIDDLELTHLIVNEFGGMRGLARELKDNYDDATTNTKVRIIKHVLDLIQNVAERGQADVHAGLADMQADMEARAMQIMADSMSKAQGRLEHTP